MLCGMLYQRCPGWLKIKEFDAKGKASTITDGQLLTLITAMTCAEIRVILDSTDKEINESNPRLSTILPLCYSTVEHVIETLVQDSETSLHLDYELLASGRKAMYETFQAVIAFLVERHDFYTLEHTDTLIDNVPTLLSLRAYSMWVAEESEVPTEELERLTPLAIHFINNQPKSIAQDPMQFLTPLLTLITSVPELVTYFMDNKGHHKVIDWVAAHDQISDEMLVAVASILLNISITYPDRLKEDKFFAKLATPITHHLDNSRTLD
jgi:Neurochondrin